MKFLKKHPIKQSLSNVFFIIYLILIHLKWKSRNLLKNSTTSKKIINSAGMGTVEIVIIIAVLVALALIFQTAIRKYASTIMSYVFDDQKVIGQL